MFERSINSGGGFAPEINAALLKVKGAIKEFHAKQEEFAGDMAQLLVKIQALKNSLAADKQTYHLRLEQFIAVIQPLTTNPFRRRAREDWIKSVREIVTTLTPIPAIEQHFTVLINYMMKYSFVLKLLEEISPPIAGSLKGTLIKPVQNLPRFNVMLGEIDKNIKSLQRQLTQVFAGDENILASYTELRNGLFKARQYCEEQVTFGDNSLIEAEHYCRDARSLDKAIDRIKALQEHAKANKKQYAVTDFALQGLMLLQKQDQCDQAKMNAILKVLGDSRCFQQCVFFKKVAVQKVAELRQEMTVDKERRRKGACL